ncbi:hypothetical protein [Congregibacter sp.]|uniref:hypothetical protein n=1 Tax=Congregibacter sp. TaxID=2744308 RepID=UPI003F6C9169
MELSSQGISVHPIDFLEDVAITLISVYAFATPIGAILTTHVLLERRDLVVWVLTCITLAAINLGATV